MHERISIQAAIAQGLPACHCLSVGQITKAKNMGRVPTAARFYLRNIEVQRRSVARAEYFRWLSTPEDQRLPFTQYEKL